MVTQMPSFTFSSEKGQWYITWVLTLLILVAVLCCYEKFLQSKNYQPSVAADQSLWNWHRKHVQKNDSVIVLAGASRIQLGLNTAVMRQLLPDHTIIPLSVNGHYPMATLQNLADDELFEGLLVVSFTAQMLEPQYWDMQRKYVENFSENYNSYTAWDAKLTAVLKSNFRFFHHALGVQKVIESLARSKTFPKTSYVFGQADSSAEGYYDLVDKQLLRKRFVTEKQQNYQDNPAMNKTLWQQQINTLNSLVQKIERRGGEVVLLRFPTDGGHWQLDERYYPRQDFWDVLTEKYPNINTIHFKDDEILSSFELPDSSHLDVADAKVFTARFIELLQQKQLIPQTH